MQKSVLVEIVRSLSRKEVRDIFKWLQSPAHNQREDVVRLFEFLTKKLASENPVVEKNRAWRTVFPGESYDDARMRQVMYFLLKSIEEYLVFEDYGRDHVQYRGTLARIYRLRKLDKAYRQAYRQGREQLEKQPLRNGYYLMHSYFLDLEEYNHRLPISQNAPVNLQESADSLEKWFLAEKLRIACAMIAHRNVFQKITYEPGLLDDVLAYVQDKKLLDEPAIASFYFAYLAITHPEEESYFDQLEKLLHNEITRFDHSEARVLYIAALNYCVPKINQGHLNFARRAFILYRTGLETGILLENDMVSRYTFGNAVGSALRVGEFGWAEQFIEQFQHHLEEKERQSIVNFNTSRVYFEKGDYNQAQRLLTRFEYDDMLLNIIAKTMLLKIYYEIGELDAFESLLESMRIYLQRKEALDPTRKAAYKNMISLMKKLLNLNPYSKAQTERLHTLIQGTQPLMERDWLLRQVEPRK
ncbi:MAG: hypothetical protein H6574_15155 [Lewinellaceae bacterium]|nr:hypothetical protein [Saprospiraceae bacterium]MCB9315738.1 hypothetical protein [Lewinellaceae bacterium]MCB9332417.1 hypothetical protein [Lewinellaceae bacterium]